MLRLVFCSLHLLHSIRLLHPHFVFFPSSSMNCLARVIALLVAASTLGQCEAVRKALFSSVCLVETLTSPSSPPGTPADHKRTVGYVITSHFIPSEWNERFKSMKVRYCTYEDILGFISQGAVHATAIFTAIAEYFSVHKRAIIHTRCV